MKIRDFTLWVYLDQPEVTFFYKNTKMLFFAEPGVKAGTNHISLLFKNVLNCNFNEDICLDFKFVQNTAAPALGQSDMKVARALCQVLILYWKSNTSP